MLETSARLLRLLSLMQTPREWTATELAERLDVSARTVRRDVNRLRELGYPVHTTMGATGGYRLGAGAKLPPLLLDDDEAVAVAVSLRTAAGGSVAGLGETSSRALAKLEQVLPPRLRGPVRALESATVTIPEDAPEVDGAVLALLATACRDRLSLRFDYTSHDGTATFRRTEPERLVSWGQRWYLVAFDLDRDDWRTFRIDRIRPQERIGPGFRPRGLPGGDVAAYMEGRFPAAWPHRGRAKFFAPAEQIAAGISSTDGLVEALDDHTCLLTLGGSDPNVIAAFLCMFGVEFELLDPGPVADALRAIANRCRKALDPLAQSVT